MQNNQYTEILNAISALRDNFEVRFDALTQEVVSLKGDVSTLKGNVATLTEEVASLREDMTEVKGRVTRIEERMESMATKEDLRALENRLMGEIKPLKESVAYLSEQSASHDRKLFLLKNQNQQP